jgi:glycosyltransferase involved in cell wall biosynthesis
MIKEIDSNKTFIETKNVVVSVIINCFNGEMYLKEAIESVCNQDFKDWEIIFWDNQSTDSSAEIVLHFNDPRIKYFYSESHDKLGMARQKAVEKATGEFIAFLDCDDYWLPNKLETQVITMNSGSYVLAYSSVSITDEKDNPIVDLLPAHSSGYIFNDLLENFDINMATPILRRQSLIDYGLNFDSQIFASEEVNLFLKLAYFGEVATSHEPLAVIRQRNDSLTNKSLRLWYLDLELTIKQLLEIDSEIPKNFKVGYNKIVARKNYYKSRYFLDCNQYKNTVNYAFKSARLDKKYFWYFWLSLIPFLTRSFLYLYETKRLRWFLWKVRN